MNTRAIVLWSLLLAAAAWLVPAAQAQVRYPDRPAEGVFVADRADLISASDAAAITATCARLKAEKGIPLLVATIPSMADQGAPGWPIERYAMNLFAEWGIGRAENSPGVLLLVSKGDRKVRIELGSGWSHNKDAAATSIVNSTIVPQFKAGRFTDGIRKGVEAIAGRIGGMGLTAASAGTSPLPGPGSAPAPNGTPNTPPTPVPGSIPADPAPAVSFGKVLGPAACIIGAVIVLMFLFILSKIGRAARGAIGGGGQGVGAGWNGYGPSGWNGARGAMGGGMGGGMGGFLGGLLPGMLLGNMMGQRGSGSSGSTHTPSSSPPDSGSSGGGFLGGGGGGFSGGDFSGSSFGGGFSGGGGSTGSW